MNEEKVQLLQRLTCTYLLRPENIYNLNTGFALTFPKALVPTYLNELENVTEA